MKAECYLQLAPVYYRGGQLKGVTIKQMSRRYPSAPLDGARIIRLEVAVPDEAFKATRVSVSIPIEKMASEVTASVS